MDTRDSNNTRENLYAQQNQQFLALYGHLFHAMANAIGLLESGKTPEAVHLLRESQLHGVDSFLWEVPQGARPAGESDCTST